MTLFFIVSGLAEFLLGLFMQGYFTDNLPYFSLSNFNYTSWRLYCHSFCKQLCLGFIPYFLKMNYRECLIVELK